MRCTMYTDLRYEIAAPTNSLTVHIEAVVMKPCATRYVATGNQLHVSSGQPLRMRSAKREKRTVNDALCPARRHQA